MTTMHEAPELPIEVAVPGTGLVTFRRATLDDRGAMMALYGRLTAEDRYRRFFTGAGASEDFVEGWLSGAERTVVVAVLGADVVAEGGYALGRTGAAELGIAVEPAHRGWLGPYLLDLVLRLAAADGVTAVVADVLSTNRPMLALLASRGYALVADDDFGIVRVLLGTAAAVPGWPPWRGPHVLVEGTAGRWAPAQALAGTGCTVVSCRGPDAGPKRRWRCPVLQGRPCPLVNGADVVLAVGADGSAGSEVLEGIARVHPDVPICLLDVGATDAELRAAVDRLVGLDRA